MDGVDVAVTLTGLAIGLLYGAFGAGGSAFATPVLALLGIPPAIAVASPLPATLPAALAGAFSYVRSGELDWAVFRRAIAGGLPAAVVGALVSKLVGGPALLVLSGLMLAVIGVRMIRPVHVGSGAAAAVPSRSPVTVIAMAAFVGFLTGLLANGGGFLLVPFFVVVLGLGMRRSAGTSLLTAAALSVPTLITHWALGHIDWTVSLFFALGLVPAAALSGRVAQRLPSQAVQRAFGAVLVVFAAWFLLHRL
jgi:uncharacterized membrane protein YfcA